jgi:N-acyl-phosphatidylethanolamine-hydrolysing phospholipase D
VPPHHAPRGFRNPWPDATLPGFGAFLKWKLASPSRPVAPLAPPVVRSVVMPRLDPSELRLTWVGHATFLVQIGAQNVLTDPMWSDRASPVAFAGPKRVVAPALPFDELPPLDLVLVSHNHYDHLDDRTVRRVAAAHPAARWVVPLGLRSFLARRGARHIEELDWWEERAIGPVRVGCTPAQHFSARGFTDRNRSLWCGFALSAADRRLYFAGDTAYHPEFQAIASRFGPFDAVLLPIGAYEPRWFMRAVHMNPEDALAAYGDLVRGAPGTRMLVGMHWGTFRLTDEPLAEPPERLRAAWERAGRDPRDLWVPAHGESRAV